MRGRSGLFTAAGLSFEPDDGLRHELHDGVVHVVPPPSDDHGWEVRVADTEIGPGRSGEPAAPWWVRIDTDDLVMPHKRR